MILCVILLIGSSAAFMGARALSVASHAAPDNSPLYYAPDGIPSLKDLFGNVSTMTVELSFTHSDGSFSEEQYSYTVIGTPVLNKSVNTYEIKLTGTSSDGVLSSTESTLVWIDSSSGNVVQTYDDEMGYNTGTKAAAEIGVLTFISTKEWLSMLSSANVKLVSSAPTSEMIGSVAMMVSSYSGLPSFAVFHNWKISVGSIPSRNLQFVISSSYTVPSTNDSGNFEILSMALS
jgi:hypothetical protein